MLERKRWGKGRTHLDIFPFEKHWEDKITIYQPKKTRSCRTRITILHRGSRRLISFCFQAWKIVIKARITNCKLNRECSDQDNLVFNILVFGRVSGIHHEKMLEKKEEATWYFNQQLNYLNVLELISSFYSKSVSKSFRKFLYKNKWEELFEVFESSPLIGYLWAWVIGRWGWRA